MKKSLFLFISLCLMYSVMISQNIENKLGTNGSLLIKEAGADDKVLFRFKKDFFGNSELVIARDPYLWPPSEDIWMLDIHSENLFPNISFASFDNIDQGAVLHFQKAYGNGPEPVQANNILGSIYFTGYKDKFVPSARIESKVISLGTNGPAADITFATSDGTSLDVRMTIKDDGTINIDKLKGVGETSFVRVDNLGNLYATATSTPPNGPEMNAKIHELESENQLLKERIEKLETIVDELAKQ